MENLVDRLHKGFHDVIELLGLRKTGGMDEPTTLEEEDQLAGAAPEIKKLPRVVNLLTIFSQDQGPTNECTGHSGAHTTSIMATIEKKSIRTVEGKSIIALQIKEGTYDPARGDYVRSTPKALVKYGVMDNRGSVYTFGKYELARRDKFRELLASGHPIMTGGFIDRIMCDSEWFWKPKGRAGGHAWTICGYNDEEKYFLCINSWGDSWGMRKMKGAFKIRYEDVPRLFTSFYLIP